MDSHQLATKIGNDGVKVGEWVRHLTKSGKEYFYNVKSYAVQLDKPRKWLEYEKQHGPVPSQSSSSTTCNTPSSSLSSLHRRQNQSHQSSSSSSNSSDDNTLHSNTVSSETAAEYLQQQGNSPSPQISDMQLPQSQVLSLSHQLDNNINMGHGLCDLGQQQSEDLNSETMDISDSPSKISDSDAPMSDQDGDTNIMNDNRDEEIDREDKNRAPEKRKINSIDSHQSSSKGLKDSNVNLLQNQGALTIDNSEEGEMIMAKRRKEETHPLQMPKIVKIILSFLDTESVKYARQVNPLWSVEGAKFLIAKCFVKIPWDLKNQKFSRELTAMERSKEMNKFYEFLAHGSSETSMLSNITLVSESDLSRWESLVVVKQIKSIKLDFHFYTSKYLRNLLDILPNLKYIRFSTWWYTPEHIIKALTPVMSKADKGRDPLIVSPFHVSCGYIKQLENFEQFAECNNIMIEELKFGPEGSRFIPNSETRISNLLNKLLATSKISLKILTLKNGQHYLSRLEFPCMAALINMELFLYPRSLDLAFQCKFPPSFRFSENTPNLQEIIVYYSIPYGEKAQSTDRLFPILFENTGSAPSVKRLKCGSLVLGSHLGPLFKTFPNINDLEISLRHEDRTTFLKSLWTLGRNLKKLTLEFDDWKEIACLDSIFAGFTQETVDEIKKAPNLGHYPLEKLQALRVNPSILNLKELKHLTIRFHWDCGAKKSWPDRILAFAAKHAFNLMPKDLKIDVHVSGPIYSDISRQSVRKSLEEVSQLRNVVVRI